MLNLELLASLVAGSKITFTKRTVLYIIFSVNTDTPFSLVKIISGLVRFLWTEWRLVRECGRRGNVPSYLYRLTQRSAVGTLNHQAMPPTIKLHTTPPIYRPSNYTQPTNKHTDITRKPPHSHLYPGKLSSTTQVLPLKSYLNVRRTSWKKI